VTLVVAILTTVLLTWAARVDYRTRKIPRGAGFGVIAIGLFVLLWNQLWIEAVYYLLAIWCTSGGVWRLVLIMISMATVFIRGENSIPLVVGIVLVAVFFWMRWIGGGDAQLAIGLIGIGHDWPILTLLAGCTIFWMLILVFRKYGFPDGLRRLRHVFLNLSTRPDIYALRTPWAVIAMISGVIYLWLWPVITGGNLA
jgi:hypothetical protein